MNVCGVEIRVRGKLLRIAQLEADGYEFLDDPASLIEGLRKCGTRIDLFTFMQNAAEPTRKYDYPMEWDNFAALPITTFDEWWNGMGFKARNKAKQAEKRGVVIREVPFGEELVKGIWEVYNECPIRQGRPFGHYGKSLDEVRRIEATFLDRSVFVGAFLDDKMIGFIKVVPDTTYTQAGLMNIVSMVAHRDKAPTNALVAHAVKICAEKGIKFLVYSQFAYGKKEKSGLTEFKERNGFQKLDVPRYYVPLTLMGRLGYRLGLHRKYTDMIPESIAEKLREWRNNWYASKFESQTKSV